MGATDRQEQKERQKKFLPSSMKCFYFFLNYCSKDIFYNSGDFIPLLIIQGKYP